MENWSSSIVTKWMQKIGLGQFSTVLNADKPFTGMELVEATVPILVKVYKMDKRPAKKLLSERDKAMNCLKAPKKSISRAFVGEIGAPYDISRPLHVEYVSGKGFMGLPQEWENTLATSASDVFVKDRASAKIRRKASMFGHKRNPLNWSMDQVIEWLHKSKLDMFVEEAVTAEVDGQALMRLSEEEFMIIFNMKRDSDTERLFRMIAILKTSSGLDLSPDSSFSSSAVPSIAADISSSWTEVEMSPRGAHPLSTSRQSSFRNSIKGIFTRSDSITDILTRKDSGKDPKDKKRESMLITKKEFRESGHASKSSKGMSDREPIARKESLKDACINVC